MLTGNKCMFEIEQCEAANRGETLKLEKNCEARKRIDKVLGSLINA